MKTDLERFKEFLNSVNIKFDLYYNGNYIEIPLEDINVDGSNIKWSGYIGFSQLWTFNKDSGELVSIGAYE